jgi:hypothetical protein
VRPYLKKTNLGVVVHAHNPSYVVGKSRRILALKLASGKKCKTLSKKQTKAKRARMWSSGRSSA